MLVVYWWKREGLTVATPLLELVVQRLDLVFGDVPVYLEVAPVLFF